MDRDTKASHETIDTNRDTHGQRAFRSGNLNGAIYWWKTNSFYSVRLRYATVI